MITERFEKGGESMGKMRHELKHVIHTGDYLAIKNRLKWIMKSDQHVNSSGQYKIRSLYFDNYRDKALIEKLSGISEREKFRLRYYNDDCQFVNLEKKSKKNQLGTKASARLTKEECQRILDGDWEWLKDSKQPLLVEFYSKLHGQQLRPKTIVDYIREPYVYSIGNVRITFDSQIRTGLYSNDFFEADIPTIAVFEPGLYVMEVKFDEFLPDMIEAAIQTNNRQSGAFSKYAACRAYE